MSTPEDSAMPLIEHLKELRTRLIRSVLALVIGIVVTFYFAEAVLEFLFAPIADVLRARGEEPRLIFTAPQEKFFMLFRISLLTGLAVAFPVIAHQMWRFIAPGLYKNERGAFLPFIIASPLLFIAGAAFAHFVVTPLAMAFFISFSDIIPMIGTLIGIAPQVALDAPLTGVSGEGLLPGAPAESEITTVFLGSVRETLDLSLKFIFAFGICFQLPVLLTLMGIAGLVSSEGLRSVRKYAVVGILVVAALVTPPDVITQLILFTVVYMLYEISIWLVMGVERKRAREEAEAGY
ncbi:twin-arginine translocase subunit TatC [Pontivivens insulae]|uniref:Sec-independent protein translocase protein TatC n=1 Tax=Pontivivens insulae TaxID=1639689 RepID=A0A2R8AA19_9RHOB|nr:twin-arginine translocase subunit TatC [Pontivivens insulae]RED12849.1 sec-independent protein translocase protein TatC [Pontivivens insulae]SPF28940.1 Sec-independent protein translocase protein TatC [Pontivivens insulae]